MSRIAKIAILRIEPTGVTTNYIRRLNPGKVADLTSLSLRRYRRGSAKCPTFADVQSRIYGLLRGCDLIGYNLKCFTIPFLAAETARQASQTATANQNNSAAQLDLLLTQFGNFVENATDGDEAKILSTGLSVRATNAPIGQLPQVTNFTVSAGAAVASLEVSVDRRAESVLVRVGESSVLQYNSAHVEPPTGADAKYGRSAFIHPLWTPAGIVATDQFPPDHLHQSGVFLAHTKTEFSGRTPNFWDLLGGTGCVRFKTVKNTTSGPIFGELVAEHEHVDMSAPNGKVALVETWSVRVWNVDGRDAGFWICDLTSTLNCATPDPLRLLKYHYGGMALRGARSWDAEHARFLTSEGKDRGAGNHTRPRWCDLFGPVGDQTAGIAFLTHPANFRAPEPLRIHPTMPYMVYSPSHLGDWEITPGTPHVSRYQFVIHDGNLPETTTNRLWLNFAKPLVPSVVPGSHP